MKFHKGNFYLYQFKFIQFVSELSIRLVTALDYKNLKKKTFLPKLFRIIFSLDIPNFK